MDAGRPGGTSPKAPLAPRMDILRFATAGSVDDGKSTLIGRLLYDSKSIFADQLEAVDRTSEAAMEDRKREGYF
jgi:sulfate adenylyltransferase subunit 1 (EFTu-like GTPase family)